MIMIHTFAYEYDHMNFVIKLPFVLFHSFDNFTFIIKYENRLNWVGVSKQLLVVHNFL